MDPALLRERELFKKRALSTPSVEKKKREPEKDVSRDNAIRKKAKVAAAPKVDITNYKTMPSSSQHKTAVLAKIVRYMKSKYQDGDDQALTLDEILDETNQLDVNSKVKHWLQSEALSSNPKIESTPEGRFCFKPMFKLRDRKSLIRLLKQHDLKGLGGIFLEDIQESLPHSEKILKGVQSELIYITRPNDKKKVVFYNDRNSVKVEIDDEFKKLWRGVTVDAMDDQKIEEYLEKQGIRTMQDHGLRKVAPIKKKKANMRRKINRAPRDNTHVADILIDYDNNK